MDTLQAPIYLDWAATTPLSSEVLESMSNYLKPGKEGILFEGNANSLHSVGRKAFFALEEARRTIARSFGLRRSDEIIFTSGATESDNAAIIGIVEAVWKNRLQQGKKDFVPHVIVSAIEHDAILNACKKLESRGVKVSYALPNRAGFIEPQMLEGLFTPETVLVSIMAANNEMGSIQPIKELAEITHKHKAFFHTDMVQLLGKRNINLEELKVDAASFSAHKICGPKGVGALYLKARTPFDAYIVGGGQENGLRSGTQNVCGAVGFACALDNAQKNATCEASRLAEMRDNLYKRLLSLPLVESPVDVLAQPDKYLPSHVSILVNSYESETLVLRLDQLGICISGASACASHSLEPSHVLSALGVSRDKALGSLRISMGCYTTQEDLDIFFDAFKKIIEEK